MLLAFKSTISSKPTAKISVGGDSCSGTLVTSTRAGKKDRDNNTDLAKRTIHVNATLLQLFATLCSDKHSSHMQTLSTVSATCFINLLAPEFYI